MENKLVEQVVSIIEDKFAERINIIDFESKNPFTDYFVICEVSNPRQIDAIVNEFVKLGKEGKIELRDLDGKGSSGWVVIDFYDVVLHVFEKPVRAVYELDKLFIQYPHTLDDVVQ